jgi:hypothetical protein
MNSNEAGRRYLLSEVFLGKSDRFVVHQPRTWVR